MNVRILRQSYLSLSTVNVCVSRQFNSSAISLIGKLGQPVPYKPTKKVVVKPPPEEGPDIENIDIDDYVKTIDTTLTPEQKEYVESIKRKIKGGPNSPRCKQVFFI
jgi:hypothetical protein